MTNTMECMGRSAVTKNAMDVDDSTTTNKSGTVTCSVAIDRCTAGRNI